MFTVKEEKLVTDHERPRHTPPLIVEDNQEAFWQLVSEFRQAENHLKKAEWDDKSLDIPTINELRYAGFHLIRALETGDLHEQSDQIDKGLRHCQRASYDAIELGLIYELEQIILFEEDYRKVPVANSLPDFIELMERVDEIKDKLGENEKAPNRGDHYRDAEEHLDELKRINRKLRVARTELNKIRDDQAKKTRMWMAGFFIAVVGLLVSIFSDYEDWFASLANDHNDQQQQVDKQNSADQPKSSPNAK